MGGFVLSCSEEAFRDEDREGERLCCANCATIRRHGEAMERAEGALFERGLCSADVMKPPFFLRFPLRFATSAAGRLFGKIDKILKSVLSASRSDLELLIRRRRELALIGDVRVM
jgi:hypothetical protein